MAQTISIIGTRTIFVEYKCPKARTKIHEMETKTKTKISKKRRSWCMLTNLERYENNLKHHLKSFRSSIRAERITQKQAVLFFVRLRTWKEIPNLIREKFKCYNSSMSGRCKITRYILIPLYYLNHLDAFFEYFRKRLSKRTPDKRDSWYCV